MKRSESIVNLSKGLAKFQSLVTKIGKEATNPFFKSSYASLPHILTAIQEPMEKAGLVITQFPDDNGLTTILIHAETGEYLEATYIMPVAKQNDPQALGSAITYARRYAVSSILSLKIDDEDDDAEKAMKAVRTPEKPWLDKGENLNTAINYLKSSKDIDEANKRLLMTKTKYRLSKEIESSLQNVISQL